MMCVCVCSPFPHVWIRSLPIASFSASFWCHSRKAWNSKLTMRFWSLSPQTLKQMLKMAPSSASIFWEISEVEAANKIKVPNWCFWSFQVDPSSASDRLRSWVPPCHPHLWLLMESLRGLWIKVSNPNIIPYLPSYCPILSSQSVKKLWNGRNIQRK